MKRERHLPELTWPGKPRAVTMGESVTMAAPPALSRVEVAGAGPPRGTLIRGDNRAAMRALLPTHAGLVDLVYLDPPFGTGGSFALSERAGGEGEEVPAYSDREGSDLGAY